MKKTIKVFTFGMILMGITITSAAYANTATDYLADAGKQIGRGAVNVVTSLAEIPCTAVVESGQYGDGVWSGMGQGTIGMFQRLIIGVVEIGTFIMPRDGIIEPLACSKKDQAPGLAA